MPRTVWLAGAAAILFLGGPAVMGLRDVPWTFWIVGAIAALLLLGVILFDLLFEMPNARSVPSLVQDLKGRSVLAVFAHADDETLTAGALADAGRRDGITVRTVTLTRGENGYPEPHLCRREDLTLVRESELRRYGFFLGVDHQDLWDYPDGGLDELVDSPDVIDRLVRRIREWKPDVVVTFDPAGGYNGHPDHEAAGTIATRAVRAALDPAYKPDLGQAHAVRHLAYVVAPARALRWLGGPNERAVACRQADATLAVPVAASLRLAGWRIHASQHLANAYPLPGWLLFDFWDKEHYAVVDPTKP